MLLQFNVIYDVSSSRISSSRNLKQFLAACYSSASSSEHSQSNLDKIFISIVQCSTHVAVFKAAQHEVEGCFWCQSEEVKSEKIDDFDANFGEGHISFVSK